MCLLGAVAWLRLIFNMKMQPLLYACWVDPKYELGRPKYELGRPKNELGRPNWVDPNRPKHTRIDSKFPEESENAQCLEMTK